MAPTICLAELSLQQNRGVGSSPRSCVIRRRQRNGNNSSSGSKNSGKTGAAREERLIEIRRVFDDPRDLDRVDSLSPPASPVWEEPTTPATGQFLTARNDNENSNSNSYPGAAVFDQRNTRDLNCTQRWRSILARREGLLDIVARTMALVRRSHILQKRVNALRYETREFVRSVLSNPENNGGRNDSTGCNTGGMIPCGYVSSSSSFSSEVSLSRPITPPPTPDSSTESECILVDDDDTDNKHGGSINDSNSLMDLECNDDERKRELDSCDGRVTQDLMVSSS